MSTTKMSIEGKHSYRFGYLKSEQWSNVRLEALAREKGHCQICMEESIHNDAHHIWYPENSYDTRAEQLVVLCRPCHDFIHLVLPECKTNDEEKGRAEWLKFSQAITVWRMQKSFLFDDGQSIDLKALTEQNPKQLRERLAGVMLDLKTSVETKGVIVPKEARKKTSDISQVINLIQKWETAYRKSATCVNLDIAESDFEI